jgi:hypothetical protein
VSASRTSSSLNGFMIAITIFISSPHGDAPRRYSNRTASVR